MSHKTMIRELRRPTLVLLISINFLIAASLIPCEAQDNSKGFFAGLPESYARESATKQVMPSYPEEALRKGIAGIARLKIQISEEGKVLRVKAKPHTDSLLNKAAAEAVKKWEFKPYPDRTGLGRSNLSRLTFMFAIRNGEPVVELYNPGFNALDHERLGYYNSPKEFKDWELWEEIDIK